MPKKLGYFGNSTFYIDWKNKELYEVNGRLSDGLEPSVLRKFGDLEKIKVNSDGSIEVITNDGIWKYKIKFDKNREAHDIDIVSPEDEIKMNEDESGINSKDKLIYLGHEGPLGNGLSLYTDQERRKIYTIEETGKEIGNIKNYMFSLAGGEKLIEYVNGDGKKIVLKIRPNGEIEKDKSNKDLKSMIFPGLENKE